MNNQMFKTLRARILWPILITVLIACVCAAVLIIAYIKYQHELSNYIVAIVFSIMLCVALATTLITLSVANTVVKPIKRLRDVSAKMSEGQFAQAVLEETGKDEIGEISTHFNEMGRNLQKTINIAQSEQKKLEAIINKMADGLILIDDNSCIQLINKSARKIFNMPSQSVGQELNKILPEYEIASIAQSAISENNERERHFDLPSGRSIHLIAVPLMFDERKGALLLFQDLSEVHSLQTIKRDFLANLAHDMRTPIATIKASAETLSEGALKDEVAAPIFLEHIDSAADKMAQIVDEIIDLSHLESGEVQVQWEEMSAASLLNDISKGIRNAAERKNINLSVEVKPDFVFQADSGRLKQALNNLAHNALKFTDESGSIIFKARQDIGLNNVFSVYNTGQGLNAKDIERVFERFYKADKSRANSGTGLGLAIVKHIASLHGGRAWANSIYDEYAEFFIFIPHYN